MFNLTYRRCFVDINDLYIKQTTSLLHSGRCAVRNKYANSYDLKENKEIIAYKFSNIKVSTLLSYRKEVTIQRLIYDHLPLAIYGKVFFELFTIWHLFAVLIDGDNIGASKFESAVSGHIRIECDESVNQSANWRILGNLEE